MDQQVVLTVQTISNLLIVVTSTLAVMGLGSIAALVVLVRAMRSDKALMSALEKLYASEPVQTRQTIQQAGQALGEVARFVNDIVNGPDLKQPQIGG